MDEKKKSSITQQIIVTTAILFILFFVSPLLSVAALIVYFWFWTKTPKKYVVLIGIVSLLVLLTPLYSPIKPFKQTGESMSPTLKNNTYFLGKAMFLHNQPLKRGDIVIYNMPTDQGKLAPKRIIALPGELILIKENKVYVNSKQLDEQTYIGPNGVTKPGKFLQENKQITVPQNSYVVLGDNREKSKDSREWGFISDKDIEYIFLVCYRSC